MFLSRIRSYKIIQYFHPLEPFRPPHRQDPPVFRYYNFGNLNACACRSIDTRDISVYAFTTCVASGGINVRYRNELYRFAMLCPASSLNIYTFIIAEQGELAFVTSARVGDVQRGKIELSDRIDLIAITTFCYGSNLPSIIFPDDTQRGTSTSWHGNRCYGKLNRIFPGHLNFSPEDIFQVLTELEFD